MKKKIITGMIMVFFMCVGIMPVYAGWHGMSMDQKFYKKVMMILADEEDLGFDG